MQSSHDTGRYPPLSSGIEERSCTIFKRHGSDIAQNVKDQLTQSILRMLDDMLSICGQLGEELEMVQTLEIQIRAYGAYRRISALCRCVNGKLQ